MGERKWQALLPVIEKNKLPKYKSIRREVTEINHGVYYAKHRTYKDRSDLCGEIF